MRRILQACTAIFLFQTSALAQVTIDTLKRDALCVEDIAIVGILMTQCNAPVEINAERIFLSSCTSETADMAKKRVPDMMLRQEIMTPRGPASCVRLIEEYGEAGSKRRGWARLASEAEIVEQRHKKHIERLSEISGLSDVESLCLSEISKSTKENIRSITDHAITVVAQNIKHVHMSFDISTVPEQYIIIFVCKIESYNNYGNYKTISIHRM